MFEDDDDISPERALIDLAEQPQLGTSSWEASNTLVFSHLIPQRRFAEARLWCADLINLDVGYESWNATSNLGIVEFESGNTDQAQTLFQSIIDSGQGPVQEARDYLELIESGVERPLDDRITWEYSDSWQDLDVSQPLRGDETPEEIYLRVIKILEIKESWDDIEEPFEQSPAASIYGLAFGIMGAFEEAGLSISQEVFVTAINDYITEVVGITMHEPQFLSASVAKAEPQAKFCTTCGFARESGAQFCINCGAKF